MWRAGLYLLPMVVLAGCSLLGPDRVQDDQVLKTQNYRKQNQKCESVNLSTSLLDVKTFRGLIQCLNDNKSLDEIDFWINGGSSGSLASSLRASPSLAAAGFRDDELFPIVDHLNRFLLNDKKKLFAVEKMHQHLTEAELLEEGLDRFGELLRDREFVLNLIQVVKESFFTLQKGKEGQVYVPDPEFLHAVELIAKRLEGDELIRFLELGIGLVDSKAFQDWVRSFSSPSQTGLELPQLVSAVYAYLKADHRYACQEGAISGGAGQPVLRDIRADLLLALFGGSGGSSGPSSAGLASQSPFQVLDQILGTRSDEVKVRVPRVVAFLDELLKDSKGKYEGTQGTGASLLNEIATSLSDLNTPISCLFDGAGESVLQVPNASRHLLFELAKLPNASFAPDLIEKQLPMELMTLGPFCKFPSSLNAGYRNLVRLSQTRIEFQAPGSQAKSASSNRSESAAVVLAETVRALHSVRATWPGCEGRGGAASSETYYPILSWFTEFLSDRGPGQKTSAVAPLLPVLSELSSRGSVAPVLLIFTSLDTKTRLSLFSWMEFFLTPRDEFKLEGRSRSLFDVFANAMTRQSVGTVVSMLKSLAKHSNPDFDEMGRSLKTLHKAYYVNDTHPVVELLLEALRDARKNGPFYASLLVATQKPGFEEAIDAVSKMARRDDGRLKALLGSVTSLFHQFAAEGQFEVRKVSQFPVPRNPLTRQVDPGQIARVVVKRPTGLSQALSPLSGSDCLSLDLNFSIAQVSDPRFGDQMRRLAACQGDRRVQDVVEYLISPSLGQDRSLFRVFSAWISDAVVGGGADDRFNRLNLSYLNNKLMKLTGDGRSLSLAGEIKKIARTLRTWIQGGDGTSSGDRLPVLEPLFELSGRVLDLAGESIGKFESFLASELKDDAFPRRLQTLDELAGKLAKVLERREALVRAGASHRYFTPKLMDEVQRAVDRFECDLTPEQRKARVQEVVEDAKSNRSVATPYATLKELEFGFLRPYLQVISRKLSDPAQNRSNYSALKAHLKFFRRFRMESPRRAIIADPEVTPLYPPELFLKWIQDRSSDFQPVAIVPHGCLVRSVNAHGRLECKKYYTAPRPKVFLYNTMNRFDSVLHQVSFDTPALPFRPAKNLGLEFSYEVAHAWGDQDPENWPEEVKSPVSMADAVKNIVDRPTKLENLDFLASFIGYPKKFPACFGFDPLWPSARLDFLAGWIPKADLPAFKARLFNLRGTTALRGLKEVLSEQAFRGVDNSPAGLEILRDLFWEIYQSTPDPIRQASNLSSLGEANNLSLVPMTVELGMLTQLARFVQPFEKGDEVLTDFVVALVDYLGAPEFERLINELFRQEDGSSQLSNLVLRVIAVLDLVNKDPEVKKNWDELLKQVELIKQNSGVSRADAEKLGRDVLDFFEEKDLEDPTKGSSADFVQRDTAKKVRGFLARRLTQGDFDEVVRAVRKDQPGFANLLQTLIRYLGADEGGIPKFMERLRESLDEPRH